MKVNKISIRLMVLLVASNFSSFNFASTLEKTEITKFNITLMDYPGALERYGEPLTKAYKAVGIDIEFTKLGNGITLNHTNQGKFDGDLMRAQGIEKTYGNLLAVGKPIATADIVVLCQKNIACTNVLLNDNKIQVHSVKGAKLWNKAIKSTAVSVIYQDSLLSVKELFLAKKINYMVFTFDGSGFFSAEALNAQVMKEPLLTVKTHHYIHKKHSKIIKTLSQALNAEFKKLKK
jgi:hypothetical protein